MRESKISWTINTWNPWVGCDKVADECIHCYIDREIRKQTDWEKGDGSLRQPWGEVYLSKTWRDPYLFEGELANTNHAKRVFTCSLSDFFHAKVDNRRLTSNTSLSMHRQPAQRLYKNWIAVAGQPFVGWWECTWREAAWQVIKETPHLVYQILTKRPERIIDHLPKDWGEGYPNVWIGTSVGCNRTLSKIDSLRKVPVHPDAVRFVSAEPLLEDISEKINLEGIGWLIVGGESGSNPEYLYDAAADWRKELNSGKSGRRTMDIAWARRLQRLAYRHDVPFYFKQVTSARSGVGEDALGKEDTHEYPNPPKGLVWMPEQPKLVVIGQ